MQGPGFDKYCSLRLPKIICVFSFVCTGRAVPEREVHQAKGGGSPEGPPASHLGMAGGTPGTGAATRALRTERELWQNEGQKVKSLGSHSCILFSPALRPLGTWILSNSLANGFITRCFLLCARDAILYVN